MKNELQIKKASIDDVDSITTYRMKLWQEVGKFKNQEEYNEIYELNKIYFLDNFKTDSLVVPMVLDNNKIISIGIGVIIKKPIINFENLGLEGYIFNMYTEKEYRNKGYARRIINCIIEFFASYNVNKVTLDSNKDSYELYSKIGMKSNKYHQELMLK